MSVVERYLSLVAEIAETAQKAGRDPSDVNLIAVTKGHSLESVLPAFTAGAQAFGENRIREALIKIEQAPSQIQWHLIGTLQKNKVRKAIGKFALVHSVDSPALAQKISEVSVEHGIVTPILLQANTSGELSKQGLSAEDWVGAFDSLLQMPGIELQGLMTMAPFVEDEKLIRSCFATLRVLRDRLQEMAGTACLLRHLSMGMSHDYHLAIEEGATLLRIGTAIFGSTSTVSNK